MVESRKIEQDTVAARPSGARSFVAVLASPAFLIGALIGLIVLLAWTLGFGGSSEEVSRDIALGDERNVASVAILFLKAPIAMVAGGLALDFISRRVLGKGGAN